jgi:hypothetical protein
MLLDGAQTAGVILGIEGGDETREVRNARALLQQSI